ncbi:hypothetical protein K3495_g4369 [Podosphaera aphanis]|nr:hypothetical protein K3495_g4369 [Podosphaera aphanis]
MIMPKPLILFIDAYDSFSNNIISLLETTLDVSVRTVKIDDPVLLGSETAFLQELRHYVAVVCGPGPGNPNNENDVGLIKRVWRLPKDELLPVLGICLGFQSLCLEFGGEVKRLQGPQHGMIREITHIGESDNIQATIFHGVGKIDATLYQSLCADIGHGVLSGETWEDAKWKPTNQCPNLLPLAWVEHDLSIPNDSGIFDEKILVAVQHAQNPFWALQYHPESICSNDESTKVIQNWFTHAMVWNQKSERRYLDTPDSLQGRSSIRESLLSKSRYIDSTTDGLIHFSNADEYFSGRVCFTQTINLPKRMTVTDIIECTQKNEVDRIVLESSNAHENTPVSGRFSIIGLDIKNCPRLEYTIQNQHFNLLVPSCSERGSKIYSFDKHQYGGVWNYIATQLDKIQPIAGNDESPFWGGFMGYTTYELGLEQIDVILNTETAKENSKPDLSLAWVKSSIVVDHCKNLVHIQRLAHDSQKKIAEDWIKNIIQELEQVKPSEVSRDSEDFMKSPVQGIRLPQEQAYESKVLACQSHIRAGSSYELCLTEQTLITLPDSDSSWEIYKNLSRHQPAPFASYIRLGTTTFISASPEQFLKWDEHGRCELRPMKGTVKKSVATKTLTQATAILDVPKEKAENLMIVDLVRHDLHGICGSGNVSVPRLMVVEEYTSVFQMISIVTGQIPSVLAKETKFHLSNDQESEDAQKSYHSGLDVLATSLPPGSMTGAPKKRSCEILRKIEGKPRSLYSGVVGYLDVRGRGDWSVNIRCLYRRDNEDCQTSDERSYHVGAGGAVTALSTAWGEREEMLTKLNGTLGIFMD